MGHSCCLGLISFFEILLLPFETTADSAVSNHEVNYYSNDAAEARTSQAPDG
jgi:hypothetical protein